MGSAMAATQMEPGGVKETKGGSESCGWNSDLPVFSSTEPRVVRLSLERFVRDASPEEKRAWAQSIPMLQRECRELMTSDGSARTYTAILEYELPLESGRRDPVPPDPQGA